MDPATTFTLAQGRDAAHARRILHIDMDAFYASVEQRDNPELRGKPVAVGSGKARGVVAAANYEARKFGVRSAMPSVTAARRCPDLIFVRPRFDVYQAVSAEIHRVFRQFTDMIEPLSLDEAYLDVTDACVDGVTATAIAEDIRAKINATTQLTASAGVSVNKFLAKLASDQDKPDGLTVIRPHQISDFIAGLPVGRFHGVGPVTQKKMESLGIHTGADLRALSLPQLKQFFGSSAEHYARISRGIDYRAVEPSRTRKSIGAETTFETDLTELAQGQAILKSLSDKIAGIARKKNLCGHTVTVKIKYSDFQQRTRQATLRSPVDQGEVINRTAADLLRSVYPFRLPVRLLGVSLSSLVPSDGRDPVQPSLFDDL